MSVREWIDVFIHPNKVTKKLGKVSWGEAIKELALSGFLAGVILGFFAMLWTMLLGFGLSMLGPIGGMVRGVSIIAGIITWIATIIVTPIAVVIGWFIGSILLFITAKLFGGKADFTTHTTNLAWYSAPMVFCYAIVAWIPLVGPILGFLASLWGLYLLTVVLRESHGFSTGKAVLTWLVWVILWIIVAFLTVGAMIAGFSATRPPGI